MKDEFSLVEPSESQYEECCIVIFGIPIVGEDRLEKLKKVLGKLFAMPNENYKDFYSFNEQKVTKVCLFFIDYIFF